MIQSFRPLRRPVLALAVIGFISFTALARPVRVACVGDSITYGHGIADREHNSYPAQLARQLGTNYDVRNFGVNATTLLTQADRPYVKTSAYTNALAFQPDIVVIDLGANDSKHPGDDSLESAKAINNWQYGTNFVRDYRALIAAFRAANPTVRVCVCFPTPDYPGRWGINDKTIREEMIPMIQQVAHADHAEIIDLHTALANRPELFPDTVHPNATGARLMAEAVAQALTHATPEAGPAKPLQALMNRRVLWLGDSITQDGKYVSFVEYYLNRDFPGTNFDFVAIGLASETVSGLSEKTHPFPRPCVFERLARALELVKPQTVVACYGMNDGIYHPQSAERLHAFEDGIHRLSRTVHAAGAELILLTPTPFDPLPVPHAQAADAPDFSYAKPFTNYDAVLRDYAQWERQLPAGEAMLVVDLHTPMADFIARARTTNPRFSFTADGIHPSAAGHLLMAQTILRALGVSLPAGDLTQTLATVEKDPLFPVIRQEREKRSTAWRDYVGYTREKTVKSGSVAGAETEVAALKEKAAILRQR